MYLHNRDAGQACGHGPVQLLQGETCDNSTMSAVAEVTFCSPGPPLSLIQVSWNIFECLIVALSVVEFIWLEMDGLSVLVSVWVVVPSGAPVSPYLAS